MRRDGSVAWVRDEGVLVRDEDGKPLCMQGYIVDITEQKEREAALLESEAIVDSSFDAIVGRTPDGIVTSWNAAAERMFGYSAEEMIGESVADLMPPEDAGDVRGHQRAPAPRPRDPARSRPCACARTAASSRSRRRSRRSSGPAGEIIGVSSISRDISERKRSQALAARQAELLEFIAAAPLPTCSIASRASSRSTRRRARVDPAARPRRVAPAHGAAPSLPLLLRGDRRRRDRPERRVVRHRVA